MSTVAILAQKHPDKPALIYGDGEHVETYGELEQRSRREKETEIFIETPYRNDALLGALLASCAATTRLCVASDLTLDTESVATRSVADWRRAKAEIGRRPAVFLLSSA